MTANQLIAELDMRKGLIQDRWLASGAKPGTAAYVAWARAYCRASARWARAAVWLHNV